MQWWPIGLLIASILAVLLWAVKFSRLWKTPVVSLERAEKTASTVQSVVTVAAILAAGIWFMLQREPAPKANITHEITHRKLNTEWIWIHVTVTIANAGSRRLSLGYGIIRVQRILPLEPELSQKIDRGEALIAVHEGKTAVQWPSIGDSYIPEMDSKIEAKESETLHYEFIVPSLLQTVRIYSYFAVSKDAPRGWSRATIYDLKEGGESDV